MQRQAMHKQSKQAEKKYVRKSALNLDTVSHHENVPI